MYGEKGNIRGDMVSFVVTTLHSGTREQEVLKEGGSGCIVTFRLGRKMEVGGGGI